MSDVIYQKPTLFAEGENRIDLKASEQLALRDELSKQIIQHKISGLSQELIYAVFHKTIRYNKREDDLNGICLSNLTSTGSRSDYVNKHVTELIASSVLISRLGIHGRILSINFNFAQWGKKPEYNRENGGLISNPEALLHTLDIPKEQAATEDSDTHAALENPASNTPTLHDQKESRFNTPSEHAINNAPTLQGKDFVLSVNTLSALLAEHIPANLALLITEDMIKQGLQKLIEFVTSLLKDTPIFEFIKPLLNAQTPPENTIVTENHSASPETEKETHTQAEKIVIAAPKTPENQTQSEEKPTAIEDKAPTKPQDYDTLTFPVELKPYEQKQIKNTLEKEAIDDLNTVQTVLDSMSSRYKTAMEPIKSPIAYFRYLLKSAQQGDFDRSYAEIYQQECAEKTATEKTREATQTKREYVQKYNEAKNNYAKLKLYLENTDKSMRQLAKDLGWAALLEEMGFDLDADTQQAISA